MVANVLPGAWYFSPMVDPLETPIEYLKGVGPQRGALGFDWLTKVGAGIELDVAKDEIGPSWFQLQRVRVMGRYLFGDNVSGWSVGLGISF